jgi:prephenate dehydrogenase
VTPQLKIVGAGLLGTSLGLALARQGIQAALEDQSKSSLRLAIEYGAGVLSDSEPDLVVVCVPPDATADVVIEQLAKHPDAVVTDVASVKVEIAKQVAERSEHSSRYVGSHPMAGREKGGPGAARADLFFARPWVITARETNSTSAIELIRDIAIRVGALPIELSVERHDAAVALVSHLPQLAASALAANLLDGSPEQLSLTGQGLRDTARIASSDPDLWLQIISQNAKAIAPLVSNLKLELEKLEQALEKIEEPGSLATIHSLLARGNQGVASIPGKHGGKFAEYELVTVMIDDSPGAIAALFTFVGDIGVNIEDFKLEHSPGAPIGLVELQVMPQVYEQLVRELSANGWRLV